MSVNRELYDRACRAFARFEPGAPRPSKPAGAVRQRDDGVFIIILRGGGRVLAYYSYNPKTDRLRRLGRRAPKARADQEPRRPKQSRRKKGDS